MTFWIHDEMKPSSEDLTLTVYEILVLVMDAEQQVDAVVVDMNIYIQGELASGFTLDHVDPAEKGTIRSKHTKMCKEKAIKTGLITVPAAIPEDSEVPATVENTDAPQEAEAAAAEDAPKEEAAPSAEDAPKEEAAPSAEDAPKEEAAADEAAATEGDAAPTEEVAPALEVAPTEEAAATEEGAPSTAAEEAPAAPEEEAAAQRAIVGLASLGRATAPQ